MTVLCELCGCEGAHCVEIIYAPTGQLVAHSHFCDLCEKAMKDEMTVRCEELQKLLEAGVPHDQAMAFVEAGIENRRVKA